MNLGYIIAVSYCALNRKKIMSSSPDTKWNKFVQKHFCIEKNSTDELICN